MDKWEINHWRLMRLLEWHEHVAFVKSKSILQRLSLIGKRRQITISQIYELLEKMHPEIKNVVAISNSLASFETVVKSSMELKLERYFKYGIIPVNIRMTTIDSILQTQSILSGFSDNEIENYTSRMSSEIAISIEKIINTTVTENINNRDNRTISAAKLTNNLSVLKNQNPQLAFPNVQTVIRTESMKVYNDSIVSSSTSTKSLRDVLWGYRYSCVGDARSRDSHKAQHGVTQPKDSFFWDIWLPPNGYNCRCVAIPLYKEPKILKEPNWNYRPDKGFETRSSNRYL